MLLCTPNTARVTRFIMHLIISHHRTIASHRKARVAGRAQTKPGDRVSSVGVSAATALTKGPLPVG